MGVCEDECVRMCVCMCVNCRCNQATLIQVSLMLGLVLCLHKLIPRGDVRWYVNKKTLHGYVIEDHHHIHYSQLHPRVAIPRSALTEILHQP